MKIRPRRIAFVELERELQREVAREISEIKARAKTRRTQPLKQKTKRPRITGAGSVPLVGNYQIHAKNGSLYATLLRAIARLGRLELQKQLFEQFRCEQSVAGAKRLLDKIGVDRATLDRNIRADTLFKEHCKRRTRQLADRAAKGGKRAISVRSDPVICDARGRWRGDIDEAVDILYGARSPNLPGTRRNTNSIRSIGLAFDRNTRGAGQDCYLFPAKYHHLFKKARSLAGR